ncbi:TPA: hypothetical protein ACPSKY_003098 [Legionella bozemanae]
MLKKPVPINNIDLSDFDNCNQNLDSWFIKHAKQASESGSAKTYVVFDDEQELQLEKIIRVRT